MKGNEALAEGSIAAGCRCFFGYPITPQNEIPEYMAARLPEAGGVFIQSESEVAAINMVYGASACGVRAMTSSSSPGISLKQEGISYLVGAELPALIINIQRGGPGLGNISASQADYFQATKGGGHGDYKLLVYAPATAQEAYDLAIKAFEKADQYRNPVMILGDGLLGQTMEPVTLRRPKLKEFAKPWALSGCKGRGPNVVKSLYMGEGELELTMPLVLAMMLVSASWSSTRVALASTSILPSLVNVPVPLPPARLDSVLLPAKATR
jgi:2-oxoglutarate ferredoxin oxidoreductase subunit alpha